MKNMGRKREDGDSTMTITKKGLRSKRMGKTINRSKYMRK
jgi:hypothetical protein